jgi:hypothetical protein
MTQDELEAGADGVHEVAAAAGYSAYIDRDVERGIAAAVIRKVDAYRKGHTQTHSVPQPPTGTGEAKPPLATEHHERSAVKFFSDLMAKLRGKVP